LTSDIFGAKHSGELKEALMDTYDMRQEADGWWTVYVIATGEPAEVNGIETMMLDMEEADDLIDLLHALDREREEATVN
jgi:hypothetical protein